MKVVLFAGLVLLLAPTFAGVARAEETAHRALAEHYAPVIFQESRSAVLDFITRFDYDGDWRGDNNWRNAYLYDQPGYVYYGVIESTRHYFITYAFYHARDYTAKPYEGFAPKAEHENDMEGCTLTIEKDGTAFGKAILLETLAHDVFYKYNNRSVRRVSDGALKLDGSFTLVDGRPAVYVEPEGHGVRAASAGTARGSESFPGLIYRYTGTASVPRSHHDHEATYALLSIEDTLWTRRFDVGSTFCCADAYTMPGGTSANLGSAFHGPIGGCAARPPWGWDQAGDKILKGDWFRDPLAAYATQLRIENFTGRYLRNPYLEHDGRAAAPACAASPVNTTVRGALTATLLGIGRAITADGLGGADISRRANQLFVDGAVLLEWAQRADLERWSWDTTRPAQPSFVGEGIRAELRVPQVAGALLRQRHPQVPDPARRAAGARVVGVRRDDRLRRRDDVRGADRTGGGWTHHTNLAGREPEVGQGEDGAAHADHHRIRARHRRHGHPERSERHGAVRHQLSRFRSRRVFEHVLAGRRRAQLLHLCERQDTIRWEDPCTGRDVFACSFSSPAWSPEAQCRYGPRAMATRPRPAPSRSTWRV
jgi:hypothetical protein